MIYAFGSSTADGDPGPGVFLLNNAAAASATAAYIDNVDQDGVTQTGDIDTMDDISKSEYIKCYEIVNKSLGKLFSKLLPGTHAKLVPVVVMNAKTNKQSAQLKRETELKLLDEPEHGITI